MDCRKVNGRVPAFNFFKPASETHFSSGEAAWDKVNPSLPFHINYDTVETAVIDMLDSLSSVLKFSPTASPEDILPTLPASSLTYNLEAAAQRQKSFYYQVSLPHYRDPQFIESAVNRCCSSLSFLSVRESVRAFPICFHQHPQTSIDRNISEGLHVSA